MKTAATLDDAAGLGKRDVFDLEAAYQAHIDGLKSENRQGHFHPSAVGMCGRRNVYEYIRAPMDVDAVPGDLQEIFDLGHAIHDIVQRRFEAMIQELTTDTLTFRFQREVPHDPATDWLRLEFGIGGTCDGVVEIEGPGWKQRGILEVKSIADDGFNKLTGPKAEHVDQAHIYALRFDCPIMWIWYYNKNRSKRRVFAVVFDAERAQRILNKYMGWLQHVSAGTLSEREESRFACPDCAYFEICKPKIKGLQPRRAPVPVRRLTVFNKARP
ncbi:MAG TPA: hypothetical protein PLI95_25705 [Polyangiaceae bacterium]|nr:hypothetical protein [Polyangiaceae bacterium]